MGRIAGGSKVSPDLGHFLESCRPQTAPRQDTRGTASAWALVPQLRLLDKLVGRGSDTLDVGTESQLGVLPVRSHVRKHRGM